MLNKEPIKMRRPPWHPFLISHRPRIKESTEIGNDPSLYLGSWTRSKWSSTGSMATYLVMISSKEKQAASRTLSTLSVLSLLKDVYY